MLTTLMVRVPGPTRKSIPGPPAERLPNNSELLPNELMKESAKHESSSTAAPGILVLPSRPQIGESKSPQPRTVPPVSELEGGK